MMFAAAQYRATRVETSNPVSLVVQLYDGAIHRIDHAIASIQRGDVLDARNALTRAHAIVAELQATLDHDVAPELAGDLDRLYDYVLDVVLRAHVDGNAQDLPSAIKVLRNLRSAWAEIAGRRK